MTVYSIRQSRLKQAKTDNKNRQMKKILILLFFSFWIFSCSSPSKKQDIQKTMKNSSKKKEGEKQDLKKKSEISLNSSMFNIYEKILLWCCCGYMSYVLICMILGTLEIL